MRNSSSLHLPIPVFTVRPAAMARGIVLAMALLVALPGVMTAQPSRAPAARTGEQIFRQLCASCHGANGEGARQHPAPLAGTQTVPELARFIAATMPKGAPEKCIGKDAEKVAAYIYDAFYSPIAQARNRPARVELSRLTVRQYRNSVADLLGSFRRPAPGAREFPVASAPPPAADPPDPAKPASAGPPKPVVADPPQGLRGEYFKAGRLRGGERVLDRLDPEIRFDFGTTGAVPDQDDPYQFSMRWEGAVLPVETGDYEFIVRTEHAVRLWVNDVNQPLIDALVKSGSDNEYRAAVFLLGGRSYPVRLEFSKGVQGVNDLSKVKARPPAPASLQLAWKPPKLAAGVIPPRCLRPSPSPETFIVTTPFPPDDRSIGYERGTSVSKEWDDATTEAALETAAYVAAHLRELSGVSDADGDRAAGLRQFCRRFAERAFRRPLSADVEQFYVERQFQQATDPDAAVKRVVLLVLKSPRFLFREPGKGRPDPYDVASRLSFGLWDSLPDQELLRAAAAGELSTRQQVARQAERMVADPRTRSKIREFFLQWLRVENYPDLAKDPKRFPGFDQDVASDLRTSFELFLDQVIWSERSDFRELLLSDQLFLNGRLAKIYGVTMAPEAPFQLVSLDPADRAGVLTHPYLMASLAYLESSSPIHRGVLIARNLLGRTLRPPPQAFTPLPAELHPNMTTRQRVALQTSSGACMTCHGMINPLGFTLEKFDAVGRLRTRENGLPVDATGAYRSRTGKVVRFTGVRDLANYLAGSEESQAAFVEKLFHHLVKQPVLAYGSRTLPDLQKQFAAHRCSIRSELVEIMAATALQDGSAVAPPAPAPRPSPGIARPRPARGAAPPVPTGRGTRARRRN